MRRTPLLSFSLVALLSLIAAAPATQPVACECLSGDAARAAIVDDTLDPYFAAMTPTEMAVKTSAAAPAGTPAAQLAEVRSRYQAGVVDFTDGERAALEWYVSKFAPPLVRDYPVFGRQPWSFVKAADALEGGMPYTRGTHVVLPESIVKQLVMMRSRGGDRAVAVSADILVHEQTHVVERLHPDLFKPLYTDTYHFIHARRIAANEWLKQRQLENPDGTDCTWVFPIVEGGHTTYVLPLIAFDRPDPADMRSSINTIAVDVEPAGADGAFQPVVDGAGVPHVRPLSEVRAYIAANGNGGNNYHPNELAADAFARLAAVEELSDPKQLADRIGPARAARLAALNKPIRDWAKSAFADR